MGQKKEKLMPLLSQSKEGIFYWSKSWNCVILVNREGEHFVSGGEDKVVKLWGYDEGICYFSGNGHSGTITRVNNLNTTFFQNKG